MGEINVTPFVDVMLVLLIVFMVAAPMMVAEVPVELPRAGASSSANHDEPLVLSVDQDGLIYLREEAVSLEYLTSYLEKISIAGSTPPILVRGDQGVSYGQVVAVMAAVSRAGFQKVSLLTDPAGS